MKFDSPLRYPGGKAPLASFLAHTIAINDLSGCSYYEPFAGGAGAALRLLREEVVSELHLNDLDLRIVCFWRAILNEPERFADKIQSVPVTVEEWEKQCQIFHLADHSKPFQLGFATFYLNRCNRSGIIAGAAPIGGYSQTGKWKITARFYRDTLAKRVIAIGKRKDQIHITNLDALDFLKSYFTQGRGSKPQFTYLDPPYYSSGTRLYMSPGDDQFHIALANYIQDEMQHNWLISYDDSKIIRDLYSTSKISEFPLAYSLQQRRKAQELLIAPPHILLEVSHFMDNIRIQQLRLTVSRKIS